MFASHGGDRVAVAAALAMLPDDLTDASANIMPGPPSAAICAAIGRIAHAPDVLTAYPDLRYTAVRAAAAHAFGRPSGTVAVANGSAALIEVILRVQRPRRLLLPVPAFSEYAKAAAQAEIELVPFTLPAGADFVPSIDALLAAIDRHRADGLLLANPNNPTGAALDAAAVGELVAGASERGVQVVIDEAFVDFAPMVALAPHCYLPNVTVLRSLTKFHAIPGVRIGFALCADENAADRLQARLPSWPVGALEIAIAEAIFAHSPLHADEQRAANRDRRAVLVHALEALGLNTTPAQTNFIFVDVSARYRGSAAQLRATLAHAGVLVRACDDYAGLPHAGFVRVAVLDDARNARIIQAFANALR